MHQPWIVFKRPDGGKKGKVYYAEFWDEGKKRYINRRSTRRTSEAAAREQVQEWITDGAIISKDGETLGPYLSSFWQEDSQYLRLKEAHGRKLSSLYITNSYRGIEKYVLPFLKRRGHDGIPLAAVKTAVLEDLKLFLTKRGVGPARVNGILKSVKVALGEAYRLGKIRDNPSARVERLPDRPERLILEREEVKRFLEYLEPRKDRRFYAANLLAMSTGMRLGEIRGLQHEDIHEGFVHITHNYQDLEGIKPPKWGSVRDVPLPMKTEALLRELMAENPWNDGFVFYGVQPRTPPSSTLFREQYDLALRAIGITKEEQRRRNLTFHGHRHWFNSMMRGKVDDYALRRLTGHSSAAMTEKYTAPITAEQRKVIGTIVENVVGGLTEL